MNAFKQLINKKIIKLFLRVWPPLEENKILEIDMSFGLVLFDNPNILYIVTNEDRWIPVIRLEAIPSKVYSWLELTSRIDEWMNIKTIKDSIDWEYFDLTEVEEFNSIVCSKIQSIEFIGIENEKDPFGVKILFDNDYLLSTPTSDGNTVETSWFNKNNNLFNFKKLGKLEVKFIYEN